MILGIVAKQNEVVKQKATSLFQLQTSLFQLQTSLKPQVFTQISCASAEFGSSDAGEKSLLTYTNALLFVSEGRVDNRTELCSALNLSLSCTDSLLIYESYKKWSKACVHKIIGDWAFGVYDTETREVFLARDQHGFTSLYVYHDDEILAFSSSIKHVITLTDSAPNHKFIVGRLCQCNHAEIHETIFKKIYKVSAGHVLSFKNNQLFFQKYWIPQNIRIRNYPNRQDYAEEFLEIIKEAVQCRLRSDRPIASMLSGGFDSGSVNVLAAELLGNERLTAFSHVPQFPDKLPPDTKTTFFDETPYIEASAGSKSNIVSIKFDSAKISPLKGIEKYVDAFDNIIHGGNNAYWLTDLYETVSQQKFGVLLSGDNGNVGLSYKGIDYLLPYFHPYFLSKPLDFFKQKMVRPLLSKYLARRQIDQSINFQFHDGLVHSSAVEESGIYDELASNSGLYSSIFTNHQHHMLKLIDVTSRFRNKGDISNYYGFSYRDPTADIRLLEFCLSVPNEIFFNAKGQNKALVRKAMQGRLPDKVLNATKSGLQSADIYFRVQQDFKQIEEWINILSKNQLFTYFININKLKNLFDLIRNGKLTDILNVNRLMKALMLGIFLEKRGFN